MDNLKELDAINKRLLDTLSGKMDDDRANIGELGDLDRDDSVVIPGEEKKFSTINES